MFEVWKFLKGWPFLVLAYFLCIDFRRFVYAALNTGTKEVYSTVVYRHKNIQILGWFHLTRNLARKSSL